MTTVDLATIPDAPISIGGGSASATDPALLSALADLKTSMVSLQATVTAIKTKTDKDLA